MLILFAHMQIDYEYGTREKRFLAGCASGPHDQQRVAESEVCRAENRGDETDVLAIGKLTKPGNPQSHHQPSQGPR